MLFIPYSRTTAKAGSAIRPIVGLGHTLQIEMLFYVCFLISMRIRHKYRGPIAACFCVVFAVIGRWIPKSLAAPHFYTANPWTWVSFLIGMGIYGLVAAAEKREIVVRKPKTAAMLTAAAAFGAAVPVFFVSLPVWYDVLMFALVLLAGLIWAVCGLKSPLALTYLGNMSFSYYLLHYYIVTLSARYFGIDSFSFRNILLALLMSAAAWGVSWVSYKLIEEKICGVLVGCFLKKEITTDGIIISE